MRYYKRMLEIANDLTKQGVIVIMPFVAYIKPEEQENNPVKEMLDEMHFAKIDMSSSITVVGSYVGDSTIKEIAYAREQGKMVIYTD